MLWASVNGVDSRLQITPSYAVEQAEVEKVQLKVEQATDFDALRQLSAEVG